jgi:hypothetical protein
MRYLCLYRPQIEEIDRPPTEDDIAKMGKLIGEMAKAGVLLATEGCQVSAKGFRVTLEPGSTSKFTVTDGPFPETKELIAGFALIQVKTKAEAVEWTKRFLTVAGSGQSEIRLLHETPAM